MVFVPSVDIRTRLDINMYTQALLATVFKMYIECNDMAMHVHVHGVVVIYICAEQSECGCSEVYSVFSILLCMHA